MTAVTTDPFPTVAGSPPRPRCPPPGPAWTPPAARPGRPTEAPIRVGGQHPFGPPCGHGPVLGRPATPRCAESGRPAHPRVPGGRRPHRHSTNVRGAGRDVIDHPPWPSV